MIRKVKSRYLLLMAILLPLSAYGEEATQRRYHDVSVIYGFSPMTDRNFWDGDEYKSLGAITAQYIFNISKRVGIGASIGYQHYDARHASYTANDLTGMLILRLNWINKQDFTLYSRTGFGVCLMNDNSNKQGDNQSTAFQLPSIGTTFDLGKGFWGLAEFSLFSYQGLLMLGVGYSFYSHFYGF